MSFKLIFLCLASLTAALTPSGTTIYVNDIPYFIPPIVETTLSLPAGFKTNQGYVPMTAVVGGVITATFKNFTAIDDVFQPAFEKGEYSSSISQAINANVWTVLLVQGEQKPSSKLDISTSTIFTTKGTKIPEGLYFQNSETGAIH